LAHLDEDLSHHGQEVAHDRFELVALADRSREPGTQEPQRFTTEQASTSTAYTSTGRVGSVVSPLDQDPELEVDRDTGKHRAGPNADLRNLLGDIGRQRSGRGRDPDPRVDVADGKIGTPRIGSLMPE